LLLRDDLYTASIVNSLGAVAFGLLFALLALARPSRWRSSVAFWAGAYYTVTAVATLTSPFVTSDNVLRVLGLMASSAAITLAFVVVFNRAAPLSALTLAARGYVSGILVTTLALVATNPSTLAFQEAALRFGDLDVLHPNSLGAAYAVAFLALVFLPVYQSLPLRYGLAVFLGTTLLATVSKTSIGSTLVGLVVGWFVLRGVRKLTFGLALSCGAALGALLIGNYLLDQLEAYLSSPYTSSTLSGRTVLWDLVLWLVEERPALGYGFAVMKDVLLPYAPSLGWRASFNQAHNAYLDVLFSSGYVGLAVFAMVLLNAVYLLVVAIRVLGGKDPAAYLSAMTTFLLVRSATVGALKLGPDFSMLVAVALAAESVARRARSKTSSVETLETSPAPRPLPATRR
jgi:O-antigen ligase